MAKSKRDSRRNQQSIDYEEDITKSMGVIGLNNLGNTCYLNSVLQNLIYLRPFRDQLIHTMNRTEYKFVPKKHPYLETKIFSYSGEKAEPGRLTKELFNLIKETAYEKYSRKWFTPKIAPRAMQDEFAEKNEKFSDGSQQDSHELFRSLISMMKEEEIKRLKEAFFDYFGINVHKTKSHNCSGDENKLKMEYASEFENSSLLTGTFIDDTFGGEMISAVKCLDCGGTIVINEDFLDISLILEGASENYKDSIKYYLGQFFSLKHLDKEYVCNDCNRQLHNKHNKTSDTDIESDDEDKDEKQDSIDSIDLNSLHFSCADKRFHIKTVGPVLTIHLKRFSQTGCGLKKLNKHVEFPLVLDMSPFCVSDTSVLKDYNNQILYGLRGIVEHSGGMFGGHYVAYVNIADWNNISSQYLAKSSTAEEKPDSNLYDYVMPTEEWYYISDSYVSRTNHDQVFSSQAYILFYERLPLVAKSMEKSDGDFRRKLHYEESRAESLSVIKLYDVGLSYLNSVLQNLLYLRSFRDQLVNTMTRTEYKLVPKKNPDLETIKFSYSDKKVETGKLTRELFNLIKETVYEKSLNKNVAPKTVTPEAVQNEIVKNSGKFYDVTQQDSHELFRFLIDMVKDEEIIRLKTAFFDNFDINNHKTHFKNYPEDRKKLLEKYTSEFKNMLVFTGTFIDDTFGGKMISTVECDSCRKILYINEDFLDISLHLSADSKAVHTNDSLDFYLKQFFSPKFLVKEYVCNNCNPQLVSKQTEASDTNSGENDDSDSIDNDALKFTSAEKQFHIKTIGPVLTIHLKRFSQTGYGLHKLNKRVEFPLVLDMSPFCLPDTSVPRDYNNQMLYGLRGIVEHSGQTVARNYVAYVNIANWNVPDGETVGKRPKSHLKHVKPAEEWYYVSDSCMFKTDHDHVFRSQAYMLFYERLPLVPRDRVKEIGKKHKTISESATCEMKDVANKILDRPNPSFSQFYFIEKKTPVDYDGGLIKSMCVIRLYNLGNTCFLNSVLQNLLYLRPFRNQLTYTMDCTEYKLVSKKHSNLETKTFTNSDKNTEPGKLTRELFKLIQEATNEKSLRKNAIPKITTSCAVKNEIVGKPGKFSNGLQQDSPELFHSLINMVRDEEIKRLKAAFLKYFNIKDDKTQFKNCSGDKKYLRKYASEFENSFVFNDTFIDYTFGGEMISKVNCSVCGDIIDVFEDFLDISLPLPTCIKNNKNWRQEDYIPRYNQSQRKIESNSEIEGAVESKESFLEYYLMQFFSPKLLEKDYFCSNCNPQLVGNQEKASYTHTDSHKGKSQNNQFQIKTLAPVLTIHLQRFYQSELGLQKVSRHVKFPLKLDMSLFCASDTSILKDCDGKILYGLRGIVDHTSGITAGHYVAYVNLADWDVSSKFPSKDNTKSRTAEENSEGISSTYSPMDTVPTQHDEVNKLPHALESNLCRHVEFTDEWYYISDSSYHETDRYHALNSQAYILFYERLPIVEGYTLL